MSSVRKEPLKIGVLVSGRGSNLLAVINAIKEGRLNAKIECVISNKKDVLALKRAEDNNIKTYYLPPSSIPDKTDYDKELARILKSHEVELVLLAGYMRLVTKTLIDEFKNKIMNIHPSLLPCFPGVDAQKQALEYGVKISGCTVHFVDEGMDTGPVILQKAVPVKDDDTVLTLSERILREEHKAFSEAIQMYIDKTIKIKR